MSKVIPLNLTQPEIVLAHINEVNDLSIKITDVDFSAPLEVNDNDQFNTLLTLTAKPGNTTYVNGQTVRYNRLDIYELFDKNTALVTGHIQDQQTALELLNPEFALSIDNAIVEPNLVDAEGYVRIIMKQNYVFVPGTMLKVRDEFDASTDWIHHFVNTVIPNAVTEVVTEAVE